MADQPTTRLGIDEVIGDKREALLQLAEHYGASNVRVFGSVARHEARPDSDIDLLVNQDWSRLSGWGGWNWWSRWRIYWGGGLMWQPKKN